MLVNLLGLNLLPPDKKEGVEDSNIEDAFIPLSMMTGRREFIETVLKRFDEDDNTKIVDDDDFDKISAAMAKGEDLGDMAPLFEIDEKTDQKLNTWFTPGKEAELQKLGIKVTSAPHKAAVHIDTDIDEIKRKQAEQRKQQKQSNEDLMKQLEQESQELKKRGVVVTFDDNG